MSKNKKNDNWDSLLSEFGIDDPEQATETGIQAVSSDSVGVAEVVETNILEETTECVIENVDDDSKSTFGEGLLDDTPAAPTKRREGKKTFFDRFPKMNFFSSAAKESLESVVEGVRAPSLGGKTFTSNKLEKVPVPTERQTRSKTDRKSKESIEEPIQNKEKSEVRSTVQTETKASKPSPKQTPKQAKPSKADVLDPWSQIASQVGALSTEKQQDNGETSQDDSRGGVVKDFGKDSARDSRTKKQRGRQKPQSMFEEEPSTVAEPASDSIFDESPVDESTALKKLIEKEEEPSDYDEEVKRLSSIFNGELETENEPAFTEKPKTFESRRSDREDNRRGRKIRQPETERNAEKPAERVAEKPAERSVPGTRVEKDAWEKKKEERFETRSEETPRRGRGARYTSKNQSSVEEPVASDNSVYVPEIEEDDYPASVWDIEEESKPVERSSRGSRRRAERQDRVRKDGRTEERAEKRSEPSRRRNDDAEPMENEEKIAFDSVQKSIPSWNDAIGFLIEGNVSRRGQQQPRRGR